MNRIVSKNFDFTTTGSGTSWTVPAGVTMIWVTLGDRTTASTMRIGAIPLQVTPNTTYTFTINQTAYSSYGTPNTFGSIFQWLGANRIYVQWVE